MATQLQLQHFTVLSISKTCTATSIIIVATTNNPVHLTFYYTDKEPVRHSTSRILRGLALPWGAYWCFVAWESCEQQEAGDTLIHTCEIPNWIVCQTKWLSFRGTVNNVLSPSVTALIKIHKPDLILLFPNAPGDETNLSQYPAAGQNFNKVNERIPDFDTTYVFRKSAQKTQDLYNLLSPTPTGQITYIRTRYIARKETSASAAFAYSIIKSNSTITGGQLTPLFDTWVPRQDTWLINPASGQPWQWSDLYSLQIGINLRGTGFQEARCTQLYLEISPC